MTLNEPGPAVRSNVDIADVCRRLVPDREPVVIEPAVPESPARGTAFRITDRKGRRLMLKIFPNDGLRGADGSALATEAATLRHLHRLGCPVPELLAADSAIGAIATEWLPGDTLESRLQGGAVSREERRAVVGALVAVDTAFRGMTGNQERARRERIAKELKERTRKQISDLTQGPPWFVGHASDSLWSRVLDDSFEQLAAGDWSHGSLDCSASNIILAGGKAYVIDLSILGAEWRERRAVRYAIATGSGCPEGRYETLFDAATAAFYGGMATGGGAAREVAARLDVHHLLVLVQALARIGDPEPRLTGRTPGAGGRNPDARAQQLLALALRTLAPNPVADSLRSLLPTGALE